jgi:hypothetical protein
MIILVLLIGTFKISVTVSSLKIPDIGVLSGGPPRLGGPQVGVRSTTAQNTCLNIPFQGQSVKAE